MNWIRHYGGRPSSPATLRAYDRLAGVMPSAFGEPRMAEPENRAPGLTLTRPSRYQSILVPVNGDPFAEHALPLALGIARRTGAEIRIAHVHCPLQAAFQHYDNDFDAFLRRRQETYLNDLLRRLRKVSSVPVTPVFMEGDEVVDSLCKAASAGTDLVVMATHGRGPLGRLWHGSVGDALLPRLSVPMLFVRGYNAPADLTGNPRMRHVLIALDGSKAAENILEPALALGTPAGAEHTLLRVIPLITDFSFGYPGPAATGSFNDRLQTEAWSYLRRVAKRLGGERPRVHPRLLLDEKSTVKAILRHAEVHDADLIALSTRGRGECSRIFQGSVSDRVIRDASVPVLVCRQDTKEDGG